MDGIQQGIQQGYPGVAGAYPPQFAPQGIFGNFAGAPLGGMIGSGIPGLFGQQPGLFGQQNVGRQTGYGANGMGGSFSPFNNAVDPITASYLQAQQLAQLAQLAQQLVQQVQILQLAQQAQQAQLLGQSGHGGGQWGHAQFGGQFGRVSPFQGQQGFGSPWQGLPVY